MRPVTSVRLAALLALALPAACSDGNGIAARQPDSPQVDAGGDTATDILVDVAADRHPISPLIYGVGFGSTAVLDDLRLTINRAGGNSASLYNWRLNARNAGSDWFFISAPVRDRVEEQFGSSFVALSKAGGAQPMLTVPMIGWAARPGPNGEPRASFSITKYGLQQKTDAQGFAEAGNGLDLDGKAITGNDPNDAATPASIDDERAWLRSLVAKWGPASRGGVGYYLMDNEPGMWALAHRDVRPLAPHAREMADKVIAYAAMVKSVDPSAKVVAPEEWGWPAYIASPSDQQQEPTGKGQLPDRVNQTGGLDYLPWLLTRWKAAGHPVDVVSVHFYPQGGEYAQAADLSPAMQLLRNRSTRALWDPAYLDTSWIGERIALIRRLRNWVDRYYWPGTPIALTEYNWGGDGGMNGATVQADLLGIFGRERLDIANRWMAPTPGSPPYLAMRLYRNYDGKGAAFGETSVAAHAPDPDRIAAFAAVRAADHAITLMIVNKQLDGTAALRVALANAAPAGRVETFRLERDHITRLGDRSYAGGVLTDLLPAQSVSLYVVHPS